MVPKCKMNLVYILKTKDPFYRSKICVLNGSNFIFDINRFTLVSWYILFIIHSYVVFNSKEKSVNSLIDGHSFDCKTSLPARSTIFNFTILFFTFQFYFIQAVFGTAVLFRASVTGMQKNPQFTVEKLHQGKLDFIQSININFSFIFFFVISIFVIYYYLIYCLFITLRKKCTFKKILVKLKFIYFEI